MKTKITALVLALTAAIASAAPMQPNTPQRDPNAPAFTPRPAVSQQVVDERPAPMVSAPTPAPQPERQNAPERVIPAKKPAVSPKKPGAKPTIAAAVVSAGKVEPMVDAYRAWSERSPFKPTIVQGVMRFPFGDSEPVIVCAEFRVCLLELNDDELVEFIAAGDPGNWEIQPMQQGKRQVVSIRPKAADLDTNLSIATDKRTYSMALKSTKEQFISRYGFYYSPETIKSYSGVFKRPIEEAERVRLAAQRAEAERQPKKSEYQRDFEATLPAASATLIAYELKGDFSFKPQRVYSDGSKTFIEMPQNIVSKELPALFILNAQGGMGMPTPRYNLAKRMFTVDFVIEKAVLMLGSGRDAQKIEINQITK